MTTDAHTCYACGESGPDVTRDTPLDEYLCEACRRDLELDAAEDREQWAWYEGERGER